MLKLRFARDLIHRRDAEIIGGKLCDLCVLCGESGAGEKINLVG